MNLHRDREPRIGPVLAPVIVQMLGRDIDVGVEPPEQHSRQTQHVVPAGSQATAELPIIQTAEYGGAVQAWIDLQNPVARPEYLAQIGRGFRTQRQIRLEREAGLASSALQKERRPAIAVPDLCFLCPGARQIVHINNWFVDAIAKGESRRYIDVGPTAAMAQHRFSAEDAGGGVDFDQEFRLHGNLDPREHHPQSARIWLMPGRNTPGYRAALGPLQDHCGPLEWRRRRRHRQRRFAAIVISFLSRAIVIADNSRTAHSDDISMRRA